MVACLVGEPRRLRVDARERASAARIAGAAKDVLDRLEGEREWLRDDRAAVADYLLFYP